ncbi:MAG: chemotaxis protein CheC [Candidatus Omnitrophica bacterium]|nr:chemotaxis protein CheC [Candidatus Omnitrophota bacterium]MCM8826277.1 chemotaxis protein CheC [Candidatus Omnitrophota bacterium]
MKDEMDILKEVCTTAAAHGSIALSEIMGRKIMLKLPSIEMFDYERITKEMNLTGMVLTTQTQLLSGIQGKLIFIMAENVAFKLIDLCYKISEETKKIGIFTEMGMSVIKEVSNIIIAGYINSLSFFIKKVIIPSFPILINAPFADVVNIISTSCEKENYIILIEAIFEVMDKLASSDKEKISGNFWLILTPQAAEEIKSICKEMLKAI